MIPSRRSLGHLACVVLMPWVLPAQADTVSAAQRVTWVSQALTARIRVLDEHLRVDACSFVSATGDTAFMQHVDDRVRHLLLDLPYSPGCLRPTGEGGPMFVEVASVTSDSAGPVIRLLVRTGRAVTRAEEYRWRDGRWSIRIDEPARRFEGDRVYGLERVATTTELREPRLRVVATAIRALPIRPDVERVVTEDELLAQAALGDDQRLALRGLLSDVRWFASIADSRRYCGAVNRECSRVILRELQLTDDDWRVTLDVSPLDECDVQEYVVTVRATAQGESVRSVSIGTRRRCER